MPVEFTVSLQLGADPSPETPRVFEAELVDLARTVRRPLPEFQGGRVYPLADGDQSWMVRCTLRSPLVPPTADVLTVEVVELTWEDGLVRAKQMAIGHLVHYHRDELNGTRFEFFGRRDDVGQSLPTRPHCEFGNHLENMERLLHHTQLHLCHARMDCDLKDMQMADGKEQLAEAEEDLQICQTQLQMTEEKLQTTEEKLQKTQVCHRRLKGTLRRVRISHADLLEQIKDLQKKLCLRETHIEEMEDEPNDLRKENEDLLPDDENPSEDMDLEP